MKRDIDILSEIDNIRKVENIIDELSSELNISGEDYGKILVATIEAVNNAIVHGNKADRSKRVSVDFHYSDHNLFITVTDEGPGFNPAAIPDPTAPENIENLHGRGVFMMNNLADLIEYKGRGNVVTMTFKLG